MTEQEMQQLADVKASLDATRESLERLLRQSERRAKRRANGVLVLVVALTSFVGYNAWSRHQESVSECHSGNETRETIRQVARESSIAAGEALIDVAGADDETVEQYRKTLDRRLTEVVSQLSDRDC